MHIILQESGVQTEEESEDDAEPDEVTEDASDPDDISFEEIPEESNDSDEDKNRKDMMINLIQHLMKHSLMNPIRKLS